MGAAAAQACRCHLRAICYKTGKCGWWYPTGPPVCVHELAALELIVDRYELGGIPLPYSSTSTLYQSLFPAAPTTATKSPDDAEEDLHIESYYKSSSIPACPRCKGKRVFELQLVPQLISVLQLGTLSTIGAPITGSKKKKMTEEERKKELARIAAGAKVNGDGGNPVGEMEWGTVMVFGCEADCEGIQEEWVEVEWESTLADA